MKNDPQTIARDIARKAALEPLEILKDAATQVTGIENQRPVAEQPQQESEGESLKANNTQKEVQDKVLAERRMHALQNEIDDIRKQELYKELQEKINQGISVPLENYTELSLEQKQVLKAQMEAVKNREQQAAYQTSVTEVPTVHSKPSRRFGAGQKQEAEKQTTRVEKPIPPSG